jgi:hypothetical protein
MGKWLGKRVCDDVIHSPRAGPEKLAQRFNGIASELGQLIEEQDAVVPQCSRMYPRREPGEEAG